jgi:hypothetical protein
MLSDLQKAYTRVEELVRRALPPEGSGVRFYIDRKECTYAHFTISSMKTMLMEKTLEQTEAEKRAGKKPEPNPAYVEEREKFTAMVEGVLADANAGGANVQLTSTTIGPAIEAVDSTTNKLERQLSVLKAAEILVRKNAEACGIDKNLIDTTFEEARSRLNQQAMRSGVPAFFSGAPGGVYF